MARYPGAPRNAAGGALTPRPPQRRRVVFVFLDGVGIGPGLPAINPFVAARQPTLDGLLDGRRLVLEEVGPEGIRARDVSVRKIDVVLGVDGTPQSGTGQTSLLTGANAPTLMGRHFGPWVPTRLRDLLASENFLRLAFDRGYDVAFANAYPQNHMEPGGRGTRRPGAFPYAAHASGLLTRNEHSLRQGTALASSITTKSWRRYVDPEAPDIPARMAGRILADIASRNDLTVFAHYDTDYVGHRGGLAEAIAAVERVDQFLGGLVDALASDTLLFVTSDHGNLEDVSTGHTKNDVPLLVFGKGAEDALIGAHSLLDVGALVLKNLAGKVAGPPPEGISAERFT